MKKRLPTFMLILIFIAGLSLLLYPTFSNWWNSLHQSVAISQYTQIAANLDNETYERLMRSAENYNKELFKNGGNRFILNEEELERYNNELKISETGIMGYIDIPSIQVNLPIYHGTSDAVLSSGVGHIEGTALPIGGKNTHCVLSGHRGLPSAKLFTNLDKMKEGDLFTLTILDDVFTYEVDQIRIVLPQELGDLCTVKGKDYCTLVTCTPYGINSHRLLVRGHRIANAVVKKNVRVTADAVQIEPMIVAPITAVPMLLFLLIGLLLSTRQKKKERRSNLTRQAILKEDKVKKETENRTKDDQ